MNKIFYILKGNNGATYIFNASSIRSIVLSTQFYKALSHKSKAQKIILQFFLFIGRLFRFNSFKTPLEIKQYLQKNTGIDFSFEIDKDCSVHISPTRDKIIIHKHGQYFQKIAFGKSLVKVKNEVNVYRTLKEKSQFFYISQLFDFTEYEDNYCSFKLSVVDCKEKKVENSVELVNPLLAFFKSVNNEKSSIKQAFLSIQKELEELYSPYALEVGKALEQLNSEVLDQDIPLGLVHKDFKPWNVKQLDKLLIYDFEEAINNGLPLEDYFNFFIDPVIGIRNHKDIMSLLNIEDINRYLKDLSITIPYDYLLRYYIMERILFWTKSNENTKAKAYYNFLVAITKIA